MKPTPHQDKLVRGSHWQVALGFCMVLLVFSAKVQAMILFSKVQGVVVRQGKPVAGATVEREFFWHWKDRQDKVRVKTDTLGQFQFEQADGSSFWGSLLPHEPVIRQTITIIHEGRTHMAWAFNKRDYDLDSELQGQPIALVCDLDHSPTHKGPRDQVFGICQLR